MPLYSDKFYNAADPFSFPPKRMENYADELISIFQTSATKYQGKFGANDVRFRVFLDIRATANSVKIYSILIENYTSETTWWKERKEFTNQFDNSLVKSINFSLIEFTKFGHYHIINMHVEDTLRSIVKSLSPEACNKGTAEFKSIYSHILAELNLQTFEPLFDIFRSLRNSIHNNGTCYNKNGANNNYLYNGINFNFDHGKIITVDTWGFIDFWEFSLYIFGEINKALNEIFDSNEVSKLPQIS